MIASDYSRPFFYALNDRLGAPQAVIEPPSTGSGTVEMQEHSNPSTPRQAQDSRDAGTLQSPISNLQFSPPLRFETKLPRFEADRGRFFGYNVRISLYKSLKLSRPVVDGVCEGREKGMLKCLLPA